VVYGLLVGAVAEYARLDAQPRGTTDTRYARVVTVVMWTCLGLALLQFFGMIALVVYTRVSARATAPDPANGMEEGRLH
jgi:hypothetical protein